MRLEEGDTVKTIYAKEEYGDKYAFKGMVFRGMFSSGAIDTIYLLDDKKTYSLAIYDFEVVSARMLLTEKDYKIKNNVYQI